MSHWTGISWCSFCPSSSGYSRRIVKGSTFSISSFSAIRNGSREDFGRSVNTGAPKLIWSARAPMIRLRSNFVRKIDPIFTCSRTATISSRVWDFSLIKISRPPLGNDVLYVPRLLFFSMLRPLRPLNPASWQTFLVSEDVFIILVIVLKLTPECLDR